ncbi:MAG TPA: serine hydrolase [Cyclobacteriaceae bacterium]|nr:serine hydrolase [Cyclobacteriaceae bacterium]
MRVFIAIIISLVAISCSRPALVQDIPRATPESVDADTATLQKMTTAIRNNEYSNVHSVLIAREGKLVYEEYFKGKDENWGDPIGEVTFNSETLHDIRSISKSVVSACVGIAIAQGKLKDVNQSVFDFFPEFEKYKTGDRAKLTLEHLLTMSSGLHWNEDVPYDNPENSEVLMANASNPVEFVLSREMDTIPGVVWKYNGGTTQLLAAIIRKVSGKDVDEFAKENLFGPLGISNFEWIHYPATTMPAAASGVRLRPYDLLKFGLLYYNGGSWNGKQILSKEWVDASFTKHVNRGEDGGYGYQFWMWNDPYPMVVAVGNGDQRIFFNKELNLVVVTTAGNYNKWDIPNHPGKLLQDFIYPAFRATTSSPR